MFRIRFALVAVFVLLQLAPSRAQSDIHGTWTAEIRQGKVFLQVRTTPPNDWTRSGDWNGDWNMGQSFPVDELAGLPANDERLTASTVKFDLRREAGSLAMEGSFRDGRGAGLFNFAPRDAYLGEMRSLGYTDDLPLWRRFQLTLYDVGPKYIRDLKTEGYDKLTLDEIQRAKTHGVTIEYIKGIKAEGFRSASLENLVRTRDHGVTQEYIKAMKAEGFAGATLEDFVRTRDHGVTQAYIQGMKQAGFGGASVEDLVRARDHGVTPEFVQEIKAMGLNITGLDQYVRLRDHGVKGDFAKELKSAGYDKLSAEELGQIRDHSG